MSIRDGSALGGKFRYILSLCILVLPSLAFAENIRFRLSEKNPSQGDVLIIWRVDKGTDSFKVLFSSRQYESFLFGKKQTVFLGMPYQIRPGTYSVTAQYAVKGSAASSGFIIKVREIYPKLKYEPPKRSEAEQKRINEEQGHKVESIRHMTLHVSSMTYFSWPVTPVKVNASFGEKRCRDRYLWKRFNCRYHLGTDYRAAFDENHSQPVAIFSINSGVVAMTASNEIDGNIVVVDHGNGLSSEYLHLSKILVKKGDAIRRGQRIGIAGKTGATDAIHLHLTIKMDYGKTLIDPQKFLNQVVR